MPWKVKEVDLMPEKKKDARLSRVGVSGYNKPKRTPKHPTKSHVVVAKEGDKVKTIRFGQQGVKGSPKGSARNKAFRRRVGILQRFSSTANMTGFITFQKKSRTVVTGST